jgi:hypothetical protein
MQKNITQAEQATLTGAITFYTFADNSIRREDGRVIESLAICFDAETGTLFKHGNAEAVNAWATRMRKGYQELGMAEAAESVVTITFPTGSPYAAAIVNKAINYTGWIGQAWKVLQEGSALGLDGEALFDYFRERVKL